MNSIKKYIIKHNFRISKEKDDCQNGRLNYKNRIKCPVNDYCLFNIYARISSRKNKTKKYIHRYNRNQLEKQAVPPIRQL